MRWWTLLALSFTSVVSADAVPAGYMAPDCPAMSCPPATSPAGGGHGSCPDGCRPSSRQCETDAECNGGGTTGSRCVQTRFCIVRRHTQRLADVPFVEGEPDAEGNCAQGEPQIQKLCTYPAQQQSSNEDDGCSVGGAPSAWSLLLLLALVKRR